MITTDPLRRAAGALLGAGIWAAHFLTIYASEVIACHQAAPRLHDLVVVVMTVAAVLPLSDIALEQAAACFRLKPVTHAASYGGQAPPSTT